MSKSLKKLIDINRLREFKNKLVGTDSAYVQTGAVDQTIGGTKTFSKPIAGSVTGSSGSCTGNAATATRANSAANADTAANATNANYASNATNAAKLGNIASSGYVQTGNVNQTIDGTKTFNSPINSPVTSEHWIDGNRGVAIINSTANAGYNVLFRMKSSHGVFTGCAYDQSYQINYTTDSIVNAGTNATTYTNTLIDENGNATFSNNITVSGTINGNLNGNVTGNAATATKLATARTIALSGAATGTATGFDGSGNITIPVTALDASKLTGTASVSTTGNAATATKATKAEQDGNGNNIVASYVAAGSEDSTTDIGAFMAARPSFIKSFTYNNVWTDAISMRHRNGSGDGPNYGTYIRSSEMTGVSNLLWNHQFGGTWQGERTLIDSTNLADFIPVTVPAGVIIPFAGTSVPTGYLLCNGAAVSRTDYANLFAAIGTLYGAGDGSTTFNLPDARDRVLQGASGTHSAGSYISAGVPNITGYAQSTQVGIFHGINGGALYTATSYQYHALGESGSDGNLVIRIDASRSSSIYGNSSTVQPPAVAINFIIKY